MQKETQRAQFAGFDSAKELHLAILGSLKSSTAQAICSFFQSWQPSSAAEHPLIQPHLEGLLAGANIVFCGIETTYAFKMTRFEAYGNNIAVKMNPIPLRSAL